MIPRSLRLQRLLSLDLSVPTGRHMFQIIGAMAEFERGLISERVTTGVGHAKSRGIHVGRPSVQVDAARIKALRDLGLGSREIAVELKVSVGTLYNKLKRGRTRAQHKMPEFMRKDLARCVRAAYRAMLNVNPRGGRRDT
jgi:DNA invertase Pin-like site-specific DNA recombinase